MTVTLEAPVTNISLMALMPGMIQSCNVLEPGEDAPVTIGEDDIYTPVAPGVTYENLPEITIVDTSPDQIIGCIVNTFDNPQGRLNALFPEAIDGDGVIERSTNDIWVYDGAVWNNVGPNPGPTIVEATIIPPWNEIVTLEGIIRTKVFTRSIDYALEQLTEVDPITIRTNIVISKELAVDTARVNFDIEARTPLIVIFAPIVVPGISFLIEAIAPTTPKVAEIEVPLIDIQLKAFPPISTGRPKTLIFAPSSSLELTVKEVTIEAEFTPQPGFGIGIVNLGLSDQPVAISLGSFPLATG